MIRVFVRKSYSKEEAADNFDAALKMFKRRVNKDGILQEVKKREFYVKPGVKKRQKREAAKRAKKKKGR